MIARVEIIKSLDYEIMASLLRESFKERIDQGLNFACASFSAIELETRIYEGSVIIGAFDEKNVLIGMVVLNKIRRNVFLNFATQEYLAVAPSVKNQGVGKALFKELKKVSKELKLDFVLSDTADCADSSIRYHLNNGFIIVGKSHYHRRTYNSYNFILPLSIKGFLLSKFPFVFFLKKKILVRE